MQASCRIGAGKTLAIICGWYFFNWQF